MLKYWNITSNNHFTSYSTNWLHISPKPRFLSNVGHMLKKWQFLIGTEDRRVRPNSSRTDGLFVPWGVRSCRHQWRVSWRGSFHGQSCRTGRPPRGSCSCRPSTWAHRTPPCESFCQLSNKKQRFTICCWQAVIAKPYWLHLSPISHLAGSLKTIIFLFSKM